MRMDPLFYSRRCLIQGKAIMEIMASRWHDLRKLIVNVASARNGKSVDLTVCGYRVQSCTI
jgi:hypothetical protein